MIDGKLPTSLVTVIACVSFGNFGCFASERDDSRSQTRQSGAHLICNSAIMGTSSVKKSKKGTDMADSIIAQAQTDGAAKPKAVQHEGLNLVELSHVSGQAKAKPSTDVKPAAEPKTGSVQGQSGAKPPIGEAWLEKDGTLTMHLMRDGEGNYLDAQFSYKKSDKDYAETIKHIGGIKLGEHKLVPPFDETNDKK